jgi:Zn-dependent M28 family amino/carboxypeptidase
MRLLVALVLAAGIVGAAEPLSPERIRAHVRFLSHDLLEGRAPGTRGGRLTAEYLAAQFAVAGAKPAGPDGSYLQTVPLAGIETQPEARLSINHTPAITLRWLEDFAGATNQQRQDVSFAGEVIFAGHGITAPEFGWDDYGEVDVTGKVVVLFTNEPPSERKTFFDGEAITYYGRWTYKFEEALRRGAAAAILIHTDDTAGYGWNVVRNSWGREAVQVRRRDGEPALAFAGWVTAAAGERLLGAAGRTVEELLAEADTEGFRAYSLGYELSGSVPAKVREFESRNVAAIVPGSHPELGAEAVLFSAHWDHLGIGGNDTSDSIFNGAVDNATGCAILLELARAWASLETKPARSALFLAVTAEESGLLGSRHFVAKPALPVGRIAAALNFDAYLPLGLPATLAVNGSERTTLRPLVEDAARRYRLEIEPDPRPAQGSFFRSDHFAFAQAGVPAFSIKMGGEFRGKPAEWVEAQRKALRASYHQPSDEYKDEWDFSGLALVGEYGFLLGRTIANWNTTPNWIAGDPLRSVRDASLRGAASQ